MAERSGDKGSGIFRNTDPEAFEAEFVTRMIVSAAGLPRLCVLRKCRRRKRCFGPDIDDLLCLRHRGALSKAQLERALKHLGWPNVNDDGTPIERQ